MSQLAEQKGSLNGLVPLSRFKEITGLSELQFFKGKGREFCSTPVGVLFMSEKFDASSEMKFVTVAGEGVVSKSGQDLAGTLWLVNSVITKGQVL